MSKNKLLATARDLDVLTIYLNQYFWSLHFEINEQTLEVTNKVLTAKNQN